MPYTPKETVSPFNSGKTENSWNKSEDDTDSDFVLQSDDSFSDCQSDDTVDSKDYDKLDNYWSRRDRTLVAHKQDMSEDPPWGENSATLKKTLSETVVVPTSNLNEQLSDERDYCLFCSKPVFQKARHLARIQNEQVEVEVVFQCPLHLRNRQKIWTNLTNNGNFGHVRNVLTRGKEQLAVRVMPNKLAQFKEPVHCIYCRMLFKREHLFDHLKNCSEKVKNDGKPQGTGKPFIPPCELRSKNCDNLSEEFKMVLNELGYDEVTEAVMESQILLAFGEHMLRKVGHNVNKHEYIRQNLRDVARLVLEAKKSTPMKSLEDFFDPSNFFHVVSAVKVLAGFDPERKTFALPLLVHDLGYNLQIICSIIVRSAVSACNTNVINSCKTFLSLYSKRWNRIVTSRHMANTDEPKRKNKEDVPVAEDGKRLRYATKKVHCLEEKKLLTSDNTDMESAVRVQPSNEQQASAERHGVVSSSSFGPSNPNPQQDQEVTTNTRPPTPDKSKENVVHVRVQPSNEQQASAEQHGVVSSSSFGPSNPNPQQDQEVTTNTRPPTPDKSKENVVHVSDYRTVHRWNEEEVRAVEKHLMIFIEERRYPLKVDCVRCVEAEPHALRNRSWNLVRDYVRNRIRVLQRKSGPQQKSKKKIFRKKKSKLQSV